MVTEGPLARSARWAQEIGEAVRATGRNVRSGELRSRVASHSRTWTFTADGRLPEKRLVDLFPGIEEVTSGMRAENRSPFDLGYAERLVLDVLVRHLSPRTIFEFGTFRGGTTLLLANAAGPDAVVHTIDMPTVPGTEADDVIGSALREPRPESSATIVTHRSDTRSFDYSFLAGTCDFVFVDGGHMRDVVESDSRNALELVRPGGVIVWDDYQAAQMGVVQALSALADEHPVVSIAWTRLAVLLT